MFKKLSLNTKMILMFGFGATVLLIVGILSVTALNKVSGIYSHVAKVNLPNSVTLERMKAEGLNSFYHLLQINLTGNDPAEISRLTGKLQSDRTKYAELDKLYNALDFVPGEKELYDKMALRWKEVNKYVDQALTLAASNKPADRVAYAEIYRGDFHKARSAFYDAVDVLAKFQENEAREWSGNAEKTAALEKTVTMVLVLMGFLISFAIGLVFSRGLSKKLTAMSESLGNGASQVNSAASEIAQSSENLSSSASEQAAAVQETSASVEELTAMVAKNADNAGRSKEKAGTSQEVAQRGKSAVNEMMTAIVDINDSNSQIMKAVEESNNNISEITKVIADIGAKTKVINDIVFQTKLLSFNASVEAARAGEHGKGFSVVAQEVGNLAQMSGNAAQEISAMLDASIKRVEGIVNQTKEKVESLIRNGKQKVEKGQDIATQCEQILTQIVSEVAEVSGMVSQISVASQEQSVGIQEITKAMSQMDVVTQQNASASQTTASASVELAGQSEALSNLVSDLQGLIFGSGLALALPDRKVSAFKKPGNPILEMPSYDDKRLRGAG